MGTKTKVNKHIKKVQQLITAGHSVSIVVSWWNRLVANAEIKDGKAIFYLHESVRDGCGGYRFTGKQFVALEISAN